MQGHDISIIDFEFLDATNPQNKKWHRSNFTGTRYKKGHVKGQVTLTYKIRRLGHSVYFIFFEFLDPENPRKKKNFIALASLGPEIRKVTYKVK